ncbi:GNAT family N-acetyltransferase [Photobacterium sp. TLY01]|uniref:GNAT family N-acetyltransferase n=1 Tax=Photobacterium sp. TLY01 TaxID=2907534 RepID=UPI001F1771F2|nr:GNAT family N-acetyltransferase [Photobacterium sp. TLY01]UIP30422.1 GNAT family N-acetyltransferase [Photobacterium sp. TLY01]
MAVTIRALTPADIPAYRDIRLESLRLHPDCFGANYEEQRQQPTMHFERNIACQSPHHTMLGAFEGEELIGLCGVSALENQVAQLTQMYVKRRCQGTGAGVALIDVAKHTAAEKHHARVIELDVYPHNLAAKRRYEQAGFQVTDQTADELIMTLRLP